MNGRDAALEAAARIADEGAEFWRAQPAATLERPTRLNEVMQEAHRKVAAKIRAMKDRTPVQLIEEFTAKKIAEGPEACRRYLIDLGIYDENGNLTPQYGGK